MHHHKALAYAGAAFFAIAWVGNVAQKDALGSFECAGFFFACLWASTQTRSL